MTTTAPKQVSTPPASTVVARSRRRTVGQRAGAVARYVTLSIVALVYISPLLFMIATSFKTAQQATSSPPTWVPSPFTFAAYEAIFSAPNLPVLQWFANSMMAAALHAALVVVTASLAAYPLARMHFRGKSVVTALIIGTLFVPGIILIIPNFLIVDSLGWLNTLTAIIVPSAASAFGVFFMRQFFLSLPIELEEAAALDGANRLQTFTRVLIPLARPALATLALIAFLSNWNDFLWPIYVLFSPEMQTLPSGLASLQSSNVVRYDLLMAGATLASIPVLVLFVFLQRYIIEGVARSGVKG